MKLRNTIASYQSTASQIQDVAAKRPLSMQARRCRRQFRRCVGNPVFYGQPVLTARFVPIRRNRDGLGAQ